MKYRVQNKNGDPRTKRPTKQIEIGDRVENRQYILRKNPTNSGGGWWCYKPRENSLAKTKKRRQRRK
jgi:hypothetical protein